MYRSTVCVDLVGKDSFVSLHLLFIGVEYNSDIYDGIRERLSVWSNVDL